MQTELSCTADLELARLQSLRHLKILDTAPEDPYDDLAQLAAFVCEAPIALVSLIDHDRQWFKARVGLTMQETSRSASFCSYTITQSGLFEVSDATLDSRFRSNPLVLGEPYIRFYAGMPISSPDGFQVGALCVIDRQPRQLTEEKHKALRVLARQVSYCFQLRQQLVALEEANSRAARIEEELRLSRHELQKSNARLTAQATTDELTGMRNRRSFLYQMGNALQSEMPDGGELSLLMVDVDHFKSINDEFGHMEGDQVLRRIAATLQAGVRRTDMVARYGGEEFAVLLPATSNADAVKVAKHLCERVRSLGAVIHSATISIGVATGPTGAAAVDASSLISRADEALYRAKRAGRDCVWNEESPLLHVKG
ncbi:GGDEF domain-containing protein [Acidipila rosea]|uniref:diguanylate cyclase n=1 Tax=Acidipila rosea TaxID=768535 RepID=A0A4R1L7U5_9BACT|nr:sensor domain-containing diguanylate cyclase [Acidipila rosea]TCK74305.1 diguanylate cyclase with GAF sensor [Acidipila rosea]